MTRFSSSGLVSAPRKALIALIRGYRYGLSPWLGSSCRFEPSCSAYAIEALERHGAAAGTALTVGRVLRCHPWCEGGSDPVPPAGRGLLTRWLPGHSFASSTSARPVRAARRSVPPLHTAEKKFP